MPNLLKHYDFQLKEFAPAIISHAESSPAREVCGVILRDGTIGSAKLQRIAQIENTAQSDSEFEMGAEFEQYRDLALAIYHSHVGLETPAALSSVDIENAKAQGIPYLSYHPQHRQWDYFDPRALHPFPLEIDPQIKPDQIEYYLLWRFEYGRSDCYSLCRSYYAGVLGIALNDYPRLDWKQVLRSGLEQFGSDRTISEGFESLKPDTLIQDHDILLIDSGAHNYCGHHLAIVVDAAANQILHNSGEGEYSQINSYGREARSQTKAIFRYPIK